jgi:hypothetical protein
MDIPGVCSVHSHAESVGRLIARTATLNTISDLFQPGVKSV